MLTEKLLKQHQMRVVESQYYLAPIGCGCLLLGAAFTEVVRAWEEGAFGIARSHPLAFIASAPGACRELYDVSCHQSDQFGHAQGAQHGTEWGLRPLYGQLSSRGGVQLADLWILRLDRRILLVLFL